MTIGNIDRDTFIARLNSTLSPSNPIDSIEHLHGRHDEVGDIEKALAMQGRHVFIFGDRGVGKSSLAATVAHKLQSSERAPLAVSGSPTDTFSSIIKSILIETTHFDRYKDIRKNEEASVGLNKFIQLKANSTESLNHINDREFSIGEATEALRDVADRFPNLVIVVDEFDRIASSNERDKFADLLKQLGDSKIAIRFIFTGIAQSLDELMSAHGSAIRQLHTKELARLSWDGRWDIALSAADAFGLSIPEDVCIRLAQISDGYPYYVHLIMEKILWRAFEDENDISKVDWNIFRIGLKDAIASINAELKRPYEKVLLQKPGDFEPVLWATANGEKLYNEPSSYWGSYCSVLEQLNQKGVSQSTFRKRIKKLLTDECGPILEHDPYHKQFMRYKENMFRGYVRMQAEVSNVQLYGEEVKVPANTRIHTPSRANIGYHGSHAPSGYSRPKIT